MGNGGCTGGKNKVVVSPGSPGKGSPSKESPRKAADVKAPDATSPAKAPFTIPPSIVPDDSPAKASDVGAQDEEKAQWARQPSPPAAGSESEPALAVPGVPFGDQENLPPRASSPPRSPVNRTSRKSIGKLNIPLLNTADYVANAGAGPPSSERSGSSEKPSRKPSKSSRASRVEPLLEPALETQEEATVSNAMESQITSKSRAFLVKVMEDHFIFNSIEAAGYDAVFPHLTRMATTENQAIFQQGEEGDSCFFIESGKFSVSIDGKVVREMVRYQTFGELAILHSMPRSATVECIEAGQLWRMDHARFRACMDQVADHSTEKAMTFLRADLNFRYLSEEHQRSFASCCSVQRFLDRQEILRVGERGDWMFIIISGKVDQCGANQGSAIGSVGLIYDRCQPFGARAIGPVTCISIGRAALSRLAAPVMDVLRRSAIRTLLLDNLFSSHQRRPSHVSEFMRQESYGTPQSIFLSMSEEQLHRIIGQFEEATFDIGETIFQPDDEAQLVLIVSGEVVVQAQECQAQGSPRKEDFLADGMSYGEEELVANTAMSRHMVANSTVHVHRLLHSRVKYAFGESLSDVVRCNDVKRVLQDIFLFKNLKEEQIDHTVRALEQQHYKPTEIVVRQGDDAKDFFLIQSGIICIKKDGKVLRTLGNWDYFGERGLLMAEKRSATCQAVEACVCLVLDKDHFFDIVGNFRKELERRMHLQDLNVTMENLTCKAVVGRGSFGIVRLVHHKLDENKMYALKGVKKIEIVKNAQQKAIVMEREVNKQCYHPCIMQFIKTFQDAQYVYFLTEFLGGGDLFVAIREIGNLSTLHSQFFSGSIVLALEYLHARGIMYRDLKPENVLLDFNGAAKLVDFGCCKKEVRTSTLIGTPDYMAPEVIRQISYTCVCDWWSLGVMLHEFVVGPLPFGADTEDRMTLFKAICEQPLQFPNHVADPAVRSLISGLLDRKMERRLGASSRGAKDIKAHDYYTGFNWDALSGGFHEPPWKPDVAVLKSTWEPPDNPNGEINLVVNKASSVASNEGSAMAWAKGF